MQIRKVSQAVVVLVLVGLPFPRPAAEGENPGFEPLRIGSTKQLFLDDYLVDHRENVHRQFHRPVRHPGNPVLESDRPWEQRGTGLHLFGGSVLFDEEEGIFKMWYRLIDKVIEVDGSSHVPERGYKACYAISRDGLRWEKPNLGLVQDGGSNENNILAPAVGAGTMEYIKRPNLIKDYWEPDPEKRYKMAYPDKRRQAPPLPAANLLFKGFSGDGIHWQMDVGDPIGFESPLTANGALFGWDPKLERYVHFFRQGGQRRADVDGRTIRTVPAIVRSTSADFEDWGGLQEIIRRDERTDPPGWDPSHLAILSAVLYTQDLYIGFLETSMSYHVEDVPAGSWPVYSREHPEHRTELAVSRDGARWNRLAPHWPFFRPGLWGTWDHDHVALSKPIVRNDEILIYYTGRNLPGQVAYPDHPLNRLQGQIAGGRRLGYAIGLGRLRLDGFASMDGYEPAGTLTTPCLIFEGDRLVVNARAPEQSFGSVSSPSSPFGSLRVEILDCSGQPLAGYTAAECDAFSGDAIRHQVSWRGRSDVGGWSGQPLRVRFHLKNAALYSFQFRGERIQPRPINPSCPGCRGRPGDRQGQP